MEDVIPMLVGFQGSPKGMRVIMMPLELAIVPQAFQLVLVNLFFAFFLSSHLISNKNHQY